MTVDVATTPVRRTVTVALDTERAFALFAERLGEWWPTRSHSIHGERVAEVVVEGREGGRVYERSVDGEEAHWARILAWEPPGRIVLEWKVNPQAVAPTEVEVRFSREGGGTRVELVHSGWERLGTEQARDSYDSGWVAVLARYAEAAGGGEGR